MLALSILFWLAVVIGTLALLAFVLGRFFAIDRTPTAIVFFDTEDGWRLALHHYPARVPIPGAPPVLLAAGFGSASSVFDFDPDAGLAPYLASYGHDLWLLDWRGRAPSESPRLFGRRRASWSFDDYVEFDLPAALETICRRTGAPAVQLCGFGLGGLALLAGAAGPSARRVRSLALLAAPAFFRRQSASLPLWPLRLLRWLPLEGLVRLLAPLLGRFYPGPLALLCNRDNLEAASFRRVLVSAARPPASREGAQLADWVRHDLWQGLDGARDYRAQLAAVEAPTLLLHGPRDPFAPADAIEATSVALAGALEKVTVLASRIGGMSANYGHLDLLLGRNARRDVFPHLLKWLDLHAGVLIEEEGRPEPPIGEQAEPRRPVVRPAATAAPLAAPSTEAPPAAAPLDAPPTEAPPAAAPPESEAAASSPDPIQALDGETPEDGEDEDEPGWLLGDLPRVPGPTRER